MADLVEIHQNQQYWINALAGVVFAVLSIADLNEAVKTNIEFNASEGEIQYFNLTMTKTAVTIRRIQAFSTDVLLLCDTPEARTDERLAKLSARGDELKEECFQRAAELHQCATMCQTHGKTSVLSFCYRIRWGVFLLSVGIAMHLSPLLMSGAPTALTTTSIALITAAAASISVPSLVQVISVCKQLQVELKAVKGSSAELNDIAEKVNEVSNILHNLSNCNGKCSVLLSTEDPWEQLRHVSLEMNTLCEQALTYSIRVPVLVKRSFCVIC